MNKKVLQSLKEGAILPEVRVERISNQSELFLSFTKEMVFPGNFTNILNDRTVPRKSKDTKPINDKDKRSLVDELTGKSLLALSLKSYETDTISDNLTGWLVTDADSKQIVVKFTLAQPLLVSQGDKRDDLYIFVNLSGYTDIDGQHLPESLLKIVKVPPQIGSASEAAAIETIKSTTQ